MASTVKRCRRRRPWAPALLSAAVALVAGLAVTGPPTPPAAAQTGTDVPSGQIPVTGQVGVHDPTLYRDGDTYVVAATGGSIRSAPSLGGPWSVHGNVPKADWTFDISPGALWAPHVERIGDTFHYYYSQSSFGSQTSAIGLKTTETPTDPSSYVDHGEAIIASGAAGDPDDPFDHNAIDPHVSQDADGNWWIVWGSHWDGIAIQRLDDDMVTPIGEMKLIASRGSERFPIQPGFAVPPNRVEGPAIFRRGGYYYLLTGWDWCCQGANSTYKISVGRSQSIDGPYVDKNGIPLTEGGGTIILDSRVARPGVTPEGLWRAPGGPDVFVDDGTHYLVYHAYLPQSTLGIRPIDWHDGWPYFDEPGGGAYDLADGGHYRLVNEGGPAAADIDRVPGPEGFGDAVRLSGPSSNQYVEMPVGILSELVGDFTIAAWVNRGTLGQTWSRVFDFGSGTGSFMFLSANAGGANGGLRFDINTGGPVQMVPASGGGPQLPTGWQHVAFTLEGNTGTIWLNGEPFAQNPAITQRAAGLGNSTQNWIGRSQFAADPLLDAAIDEFQIFDRALSQAELAELVAEPGGGEIGGGDVAWYRFDEEGGEAVVDSSGRGNDATIVAGGLDPDAIHNPMPSDRCLTAAGGGESNVLQSTCDEAAHGQVWRLERAADGFHRFRSMAGDRGSCLAIADGSGEPGTNVEVAPCDGGDERQRWYLDDTGHGFHRPVVAGANLALEVGNDGGIVETNVVGGYRRDGENRATHPVTGVSCASGPAICADAGQWPPQQWQLVAIEAPPLDETPPVTAAGFQPPFPDGSNGWYRTSPTLILDATDEGGSGLLDSHYRVDSQDWEIYNAIVPPVISGDGEHVVEYRSVDGAGNVEEAGSLAFKLDATPPVTAAALNPAEPGAGGSYRGPIEVTLTAADATSGVDRIEYRVDGGPWTEHNPLDRLRFDDIAEHEIGFRSTDLAGNVEEEKTLAFAIVGEPRLRLAARPKQRRVGPRRERVAYRVSVSNLGAHAAGAVRVCVAAPKRRLAVGGPRCRGIGAVPAGETRKRKVTVRIRRAARGRLTKIALTARSPGTEARRAVVRLRVRR